MIVCHVCGAECEDETELCPVCGAQLRRESEIAEEETMPETVVELKNPALAVSVEDVVSAEIFRDILHENDIPFTCEEGGLKVVFGGGFVAEDIYVEDYDVEKVQQLYDDFINSEPEFEDEIPDGEEV